MFKRNTPRISRVNQSNQIPCEIKERTNNLKQRFSREALYGRKASTNSRVITQKHSEKHRIDETKTIKSVKKSKTIQNNCEAIEIIKSNNLEKRISEINPEFHNFFFSYKPPFESKLASRSLRQVANHYKLNFTTNIRRKKNKKTEPSS